MKIDSCGAGIRWPGRSTGRFPFTMGVTAAVVVAALMPLATAGCESKAAERPVAASRPASRPSSEDTLRARFLGRYGLKGRVALIEFGLVGCKLSDAGLKQMAWLHREKAIPGLAYVRVEASKDAAAVEKYYRAKPLKFPVHRDPDGSLGRAFAATAYPTFVIVGKFGRVRYRGRFPEGRLQEWAKTLLAEDADPGPDVALLGAVELDVPKLLAQTKLPDLKGRVQALGGLMGPGGLLLMFVDTTCPFSGQALRDMPTVATTLGPLNIPRVLINIDDPEQDVKKHFANRQTGATVLYDVTSRTRNYWNVQSVPTVIFIDPGKKIRYNGGAVWAKLAAAVEKARGLKAGTVRFEAKGTEFG